MKPEMWECKDCGTCWSESKAIRCINHKCMGKDIFIFWKSGTVKFNVDDYPVEKQMLRTPAKTADKMADKKASRDKVSRSKPKIKNKKESRDKNTKTEVKLKLKSKLISYKKYMETGKLTDLF